MVAKRRSAVTVGVEVGKGVGVKEAVDGRVEVARDASSGGEIDCSACKQSGDRYSKKHCSATQFVCSLFHFQRSVRKPMSILLYLWI